MRKAKAPKPTPTTETQAAPDTTPVPTEPSEIQAWLINTSEFYRQLSDRAKLDLSIFRSACQEVSCQRTEELMGVIVKTAGLLADQMKGHEY